MKTGTLVSILIIALPVLICVGSCTTLKMFVQSEETKILIKAAASGNYSEVKRLIEEGADVNARDRVGETALMGASWNGHTEVVKLLIEAEADINAQDNWGHTALKLASKEGHTEIVKLLREASAE